MRRTCKWTCMPVPSEAAKRSRRSEISHCASTSWTSAWHCWFATRLRVFSIPNSPNQDKNGSGRRRDSGSSSAAVESTNTDSTTIAAARRGRHWPFRMVLFCLAVLCYANSYEGEFVFDDTEAVVNNKDVTRPFRADQAKPLVQTGTNERGVEEDGFWTLIENDFWGTPLSSNLSHKSWRPLTTLTFRLNYLWSQLDSRSYHVVNIVLHAIVVLLSHEFFLAILSQSNKSATNDASGRGEANAHLTHSNNGHSTHYVRSKLRSSWRVDTAAKWASLIFAVHPVHTECVASIVGRAELLSALFFLSSFLLYVQACASNRSRYLWLCITSSFLAMLSKEQGVTVLGLCGAYDTLVTSKSALKRFWENIERRRSDACNNNTEKRVSLKEPDLMVYVYRISYLTAASVVILYIRFYIMDFGIPRFAKVDNPASFHPNVIVRAINYNYLYALNAWLLLSPTWLCFDYSMGCIPLIIGWTDYRLLIVLVFWLAAAYLIHQSLSAKNEATRAALRVALLVIGITFLPVSNIPFRVGFVLAERVLYLPSLGYCMLAGLAIAKLSLDVKTWRKALYQSLPIMLLSLLMAKSIHRSNEWRSEFNLFTSGALVCPSNAKVHYNLGIIWSKAGRLREAESAYETALRFNPEYDHAMNNLGNLLKEMKRFREAEVMLERAVGTRNDFAAAWMNLGIVQAALGKFNESEQSYLTALHLRRHYPDCHFNLGNLYVEQGRLSKALHSWTIATDQKPSHAKAWTNIVILFDNADDCEKGVEHGLKALLFVKNDAGLHFSLANCLGKLERFEDAEAHFRAALRLSPQNANYWANLAVLLHRWKRYKEADTAYRKAVALDPTSASIAKNYQLLRNVYRVRE